MAYASFVAPRALDHSDAMLADTTARQTYPPARVLAVDSSLSGFLFSGSVKRALTPQNSRLPGVARGRSERPCCYAWRHARASAPPVARFLPPRKKAAAVRVSLRITTTKSQDSADWVSL